MRQAIKRALPVFAVFAGASFIGTALAASQRTFVASTGVDTNACSISAPCRSFSAAIAKTSAPGEVIVLDSAGYGPVTIDKSISLIAPAGIHAGVTVSSGDGITVDAPGSTVLLRGLSINGHGGVTGVNVLQVTVLRIENCVISGMTGDGVLHGADASALFVVDTSVRDNLGNGIDFVAHGIVVLDRVRSEGNQFDGLFVLSLSDVVDASVTQSHLAYNGRNGINVATSTVLSNPQILVDRSTLEYNGAAGFVLGRHACVIHGHADTQCDLSQWRARYQRVVIRSWRERNSLRERIRRKPNGHTRRRPGSDSRRKRQRIGISGPRLRAGEWRVLWFVSQQHRRCRDDRHD